MHRFLSLRVAVSGFCALLLGTGSVVRGQSSDPVLATSQIIITGGGITIQPPTHVVPRNIATAVQTVVGVPGTPGGSGELLSAFPPDAIMVGELIGPSLGTPVTLTTRPGESFRIQPLAIAGLHFLRNIRLVSGGATLLTAQPDAVTIEVIERVLVSQVTSRPLTADEIRDRGIVIDQTNYQAVSFSAAFGFQGRQVTIDFPMIVPARVDAALAPAVPPLQLPALQPSFTPIPSVDLPKLIEAFQTPNVSVGGLLLRIEDEDIERAFNIPPLSGVIVIPGNIAYLNQFFSIMTLVSNAAPGHSNLTAHDVKAEIVLPGGADTVPGSGDDPLRMAKLGSPPQEQSKILPVTLAGPDGRFGTSDDILFIAPQLSGNSEHLVEGLREGIHTIEIKISAMLHGLPIGPVPISGRVLGTVEVRNPTFALTLTHPATITAGEEYDLLVTVTNTSQSPANLASINLLPRSISGATLLSASSVQIDSIAPGDSETAAFRLLSQTTGTVTATSFTSEGIPGRFELSTAVGALGIPMSPNTLILPPEADALPTALRSAGIGFLGQAFALATSPSVPQGLLPIRQQIVYDRATILSQAGQRLGLQEPLASVARDLLLDWAGNEFARLDARYGDGQDAAQARAEQDFRAFDELFRRSRRGHQFSDAIGAALSDAVQSAGPAPFMQTWALEAVSRAPHIAALAVPASGGSLGLQIIDPSNRLLGAATPGAAIERTIPFGTFAPLTSGSLAAVSTPQAGQYEVGVMLGAAGTFDLGLLVAEGSGIRRLSYSGVSMNVGHRARVRFTVGGTNTYALEIDDNGDGVADRTVTPSVSEIVNDAGPRLVSAVQLVTGRDDPSRWGQLIALVFNEEITAASAQDRLDAAQLTNYSVAGNQVLGASLQPGGRVVLLSLRDGVGPLVSRTVTVTGIQDPLGNAMSPSPATATIVSTIEAPGGRISGRVVRGSGTVVPGARIRLAHTLVDGERTLTIKDAAADGSFNFDYVPLGGTHIEAIDSETGERGDVRTTLRSQGQHFQLDVILLGTGTVAGVVRSPAGVPLSGAVVRATSLTRFGDVFAAVTDTSGAYALTGVPVGNLTIDAAHVATNSRTVIAAALPVAGGVVIQDLTLIPAVQAPILTGAVAGQVFRPDGVTPAAGIPVFTSRGGLATTDASGAFRIDLLPIGELSIRTIDQARFEQGNVTTTVTAGFTQPVTLRLFGGTATIRGVVLNADGDPVAGAQVGGGPSLLMTSATGEFEMLDVPLGQRTISALEAATRSTGQSSVNLNVPGEVANVQIVLGARGTIAGRIFNAQGSAMPQLRVFLLGAINLATVTDNLGGYRFDNIPIGSYQISAFQPDFSDGNIVSTRLSFRGEVRTTNVTFRGKGQVTATVFNAAGTARLGATVGLSELKVRTALLRDAANTNCLPDAQVGDITVDLPDCQVVGIGFRFEPLTRIADTDVETGEFTFNDVFVGSVTVEAASALSPTVVSARGEIPTPGQTLDLELRLTATSVVTGIVFLPDGQPAGADVIVTLDGRNVVTNATGRYTQFEVPAGAFVLTASDPSTGFVAQVRGSVAAGLTAEVPIRLLGKGSVSVEVRGANGPVQGAVVRVRGGSFPNDDRPGTTAANGRVTFAAGDAMFEGPFSASAFDSASGITGFASGTVVRDAQADVVIQLPNEAGVVVGRFLTPGDVPVPNGQIRLSAVGGEAFATSDNDGAFRFDGVRVGNVTLEAFDPVTARRGRSTGAVSAHQQTVTIDVHQVPQGTVRGAVRLSTDSSAVASANVTLSVNSTFDAQFRTTTALDGTFSVPGVSAGSFNISVSDPASGLSGSTSGSLSTEGQVVTTEVVLQVPARGRVEGHVTTATGDPAGGAQVSLGSRQTTADASGFYFFDGVGMGNVTVLAMPLAGPDGGRASGSLVFTGEVLTLDVRFIGTGSVSGIVRSGGAPVSFATVSITSQNASGRGFSSTTQTSASGTYAFATVPVGNVSVTAVQAVTGLAGSSSGSLASHGAALELDIALQPSGSVRARIVRETGGAPVPGLAVQVIGSASRYGSTNADGVLQFGDLALGTYQIAVSDPLGEGIARSSFVLDEAGEAIDLEDVTLDESRPSVTAIAPANGLAQVPVSAPIVVTFSERVNPATITTANLRVAAAAGPIAGTWTLGADGRTATFAHAAPFTDFTQVNVKVMTAVQDLAGRSLVEEFTSGFQTADSVPPTIVSTSPAAAAIGVTPEALVRVAYNEAINPAAFAQPAIELRLAGAPVAGHVTPILSNTALVFTPTLRLEANAVYSVVVRRATDSFGNLQPQETTFSFSTIDTSPPVIQLAVDRTSAIEGSVIAATVTAGAATDVASVEFMVNGTVVRTDTTSPFDASIAVTSTVRPTFAISARATDHAGNISSPASVTITVETDTPPVAEILGPAAGTVVNSGAAVSLRVRGTDDRGVSRLAYQTTGQLTLAGAFTVNPPAVSSEVTFNIPIPASTAPGPLTLKAAAADVAGAASATVQVAVTISDATQPAVQILSPASGASVDAGDTVTVLVSAADNGPLSSITLHTTGAAVFTATRQISPAASSAQASFDVPVPLAPETTTLNISVTAQDAAGNQSGTASRSYGVIVPDTTRPTLTNLSTRTGSTRVLPGESALLRANVSDNVGVTSLTFQVEGGFTATGTIAVVPQVLNGTTDFAIAVPATTPNGSQITIRVRSHDAAGNASDEATIVLTVGDTAPPLLTVTTPADGAQVAPGQTITMTVHVTDDTAVRRVVFNASGVHTASFTSEVQPPSASADASFVVAVPASTAAGTLVLTAEALDLAGNSSGVQTRSVIVTDVVSPVVQITSPSPGALVDPRSPLPVTVEGTDAVGINQVTFNASGAATASEIRAVSPAATSTSQQFTIAFGTLPPAGGPLTLVATARDAAGNVGTAPQVVVQVMDVVAPTVTAITPANGATAVDPQTVVLVEFSEPMNASTLTASNVTLMQGGTIEPITISLGSDGRLVTLTPVTRPLALNTVFTVTIGATVADVAGNQLGTPRVSTFRTASPDVTPPRVQATNPANNAVEVGLTTPIDVTFTEPIEASTVTTQSFRVGVSGSPIAGAIALLDGQTRARFLAVEPLPTDAIVVVELTAAITDVAGNALVNTDGSPLTTPYTFTFVTGDFGITSPAAGVDVVENSSLLIEARASAALGAASVLFTVNGEALPVVSAPPFVRTFEVPAAASTPVLTIVASARNAQGTQIASDTRIANVVVGLRMTPPIAGVPLSGTRRLRVSLSSAMAEDLSIALSAGNPALVSFAVNPVVLPAGQTTVEASVAGQSVGNTAVFATSARGTASAIVSISEIVPGQMLVPTADPVGVSLLNPPSAGTVIITPDGGPVALSGLVSWWRADGNALDSTGTNHGILQNGATFGSGRFGQAFSFDGMDDHIMVPHNANLNAGGAIALSAWVNASSAGHGRPIIQKRSSANVGGYTFETSGSNGLQFGIWTNGALQLLQTADGILSTGNWHLVTATFDGSTMRIFVDGQERASRAVSGTVDQSSEPVVIGRNVVVPSFAWHGLLDEIEVYGRALSAQEIQTLFSGTTAGLTRTVAVAVLASPASASTNVTITSTNPAVATATSGPIAANGQVAQLTITAGQPGVATLIVRAGGEARSVTVMVGAVGAGSVPVVLAKPVGASLANPPIVGQAIAAAGTQSVLTLGVLGAPAGADTPVTVESSNPAVATAVASAIAAGSQVTTLTIETQSNGTATLILRAGGVVRAVRIIVGATSAGSSPLNVAPLVGASVIPPPSLGAVFAPLGVSRTISVRVLSAPAASPTPVTVTSSDPSIVTLAVPAVVPAGQQVAELQLSTGAGGTATLTIEAAGARFAIDVVVGSNPTAASRLVAGAPVGVAVRAAPSLGRIIAPANVGSTPAITVPLLSAPAAAPVSVTVTTSDTSIAGIGTSATVALTIDAGSQVLALPLSIPGTEGVALLTFDFEGQRRELLVIVGNPPASQIPAITAPAIGVQVQP